MLRADWSKSIAANKEVHIMAREKLPQNVQSLIGEIGESLVLLRLYLKTHSLPANPGRCSPTSASRAMTCC